MRSERRVVALMSVLAGALIGAAFFYGVAGPHVISPVSIDWVMRADLRIHFLGWHIFRGEPWSWPPGLVSGYYHAPDGTSIGYTDSIPLVACPLKVLSPWLPMPMQYLGLWLLACFALQGVFGALIAGLWKANLPSTLAVSTLFVLMPTLLNRAPHPTLCAHWTLLWAIWLYLRWRPEQPLPVAHMIVLTGIVSLLHPYLAVMAMGVLGALIVRFVIDRWSDGLRKVLRQTVPVLLAMSVVLLAGWWMCGLFIIGGGSMSRVGLALYSMNLLAPLTPLGWSTLLPEIPLGSDGQVFEGFHYFGAGVLALIVVALACRIAGGRLLFVRLLPLIAVCVATAVYALGPRVTFANHVLLDWSSVALERYAVFAAPGRFFWPAEYVTLALAAGAVLSYCSRRTASVALAACLLVQVVDIRPGVHERLTLTRSAAFYEWPNAPRSPVWAAALPNYRHIVLYFPAQCGPAPTNFEMPGYLAGLYRLTMNVGEVARFSEPARAAYCAELAAKMAAGQVKDDEIYLVHPDLEAGLRAAAPSLVCGEVDRLRVCVTARSYESWRDAAAFQ